MVSTVDGQGRGNCSPKVWWVPTSYEPPQVLLSLKPETDTAANIDETGFWVLHIPSGWRVREVLHTAKRLPRGENELDDVGLEYEWLEPGPKVPARVPYMPYWPWFVCMSVWKTRTGDHDLYCGQVSLAGGFKPATPEEPKVSKWPMEYVDGIEDVLLHRGANIFRRSSGGDFGVEPYG
jgi:flavin reductase (DIM6/NTAB) family NADH-FMN oxidoreductase RutF